MNRIQQIFRDHADAYLRQRGAQISDRQRRAIAAIRACRNGDCGHHLYACPDCGETHVANSSCGDRHCPVCQHGKNASWTYRQQLRRLPCTYFLATFTLPAELRSAALSDSAGVYAALFESAAESLRTLEADKRFVGCKVAGFFGVLHTWGRQLQYHPHVHFVVPGGGLSEGRDRWVAATGNFLVHVRALSRMFRGKMKQRMRELGRFDSIPAETWAGEWVVHCQAVGDGERTLKYLGAYVFRVAISDVRIVSYDGARVVFKYQKVGSSKWRQLALDVFEFIRRYLQHVLPPGFVKVRHYGFLSPNFGVPLQRIRELICVLYEILRGRVPKAAPPRKPKPLACDRCGAIMVWRRFFPPMRARAAPA